MFTSFSGVQLAGPANRNGDRTAMPGAISRLIDFEDKQEKKKTSNT